MRKFYLSLVTSFLALLAMAQTNPTALALPVTENFGTATFTSARPGMASWTGDGARPYATQAEAEASSGGADATINGADPVSGNAGGQYGHAPSANGRLTVLQSGNGTNGSTQVVLAVNTTGAAAVTLSYDLVLTVANARDFGMAVQYRVGTSGAFTTLAGSAVTYNASTSNGGDADGTNDFDNYSINLPAAALNQATVQIRWINWRPSTGTGSACGVGIDNISVSSGAISPCAEPTAQATALNLTPTTNSIAGSFTAASPAAQQYLVVMTTNGTLSAQPADGTTYAPGQALGGGTVLQTSNATSFNATGLTAATTYRFFIYALNNTGCSGGPNYLITNPLTGNTTTQSQPACTTPAAAPTNLILTAGTTSINGSFTASATANRYLVVRSTSNVLSINPINGTTYTAGQALGNGTVVQYGATTSFSATGLTSGTTYYFFIFSANGACTGEPFYLNVALTGSKATTTGGGVPSGYYNAANGLACQALKTALYNIISTGATVLTYTPGVWQAFQTTDQHRNFENTRNIMWDMYSDKPGQNEPYEYLYGADQCGNYTAESDCYNREHSFPQSWFNSASPMVTDIHHLVPTDGFVNNKRGNFAYGETSSPVYTSQNGSKQGPSNVTGFTGQVFEPIPQYKGDFARMQLYMAVRYENLIAGWQNNSNANDLLNGTSYQVFDDWYLKLMYKWHTDDPVSQKEIDRNNAVYLIQGNRNPFIDSADYALRIWSCTGLIGPATSVNDLLIRNNKFSIIPSPVVNGNLQFALEKPFNEKATITLFNVMGREVSSYVLPAQQTVLKVNADNLANGTYFAKLATRKGFVVRQFTVLR